MRVYVERHPDIRVPHQVLQRFRIHPGSRLVAAVGMATHVRSDVRHLHPVYLVVAVDHVIEAMLPMHRYQRHPLIIQVQESGITINHLFKSWRLPVFNTQHSRGYASVRCMIPGKRKAFIKCPDTVPCSTCPYKGKKQAPIISWDGLVETGYEPIGSAPVDEQTIAKTEYEGIKAMMDAEDPRIARAFEMKELQGYSVREISAELHISQPRVYQLIARAKTIGMEYRKING